MAEAAVWKERYRLIDGIRGLCVLGMVIYHTLFDIAAFSGNIDSSPLLSALEVVRDLGAAVFILLSGFCFLSCRRRLRRFLLLFTGGILVSAVSFFVMPDAFVLYGILTFMAVSGVIMIPLDRLFRHIPPLAGLILSLLSFFVLFEIGLDLFLFCISLFLEFCLFLGEKICSIDNVSFCPINENRILFIFDQKNLFIYSTRVSDQDNVSCYCDKYNDEDLIKIKPSSNLGFFNQFFNLGNNQQVIFYLLFNIFIFLF